MLFIFMLFDGLIWVFMGVVLVVGLVGIGLVMGVFIVGRVVIGVLSEKLDLFGKVLVL